jgi:uncharacterized membrane protein (DUF485 family)
MKNKKEFSKKLTTTILIVYTIFLFMISILGFFNISYPIVGIITATIAIPTTCVLGYLGKASVENYQKIRNWNIPEVSIGTEVKTDAEG